jgi:hypothetical protein
MATPKAPWPVTLMTVRTVGTEVLNRVIKPISSNRSNAWLSCRAKLCDRVCLDVGVPTDRSGRHPTARTTATRPIVSVQVGIWLH